MSQKVIAVAVDRSHEASGRGGGLWCAYINAVPGQSHREEYADVAKWGAKLRKEIAEAIFPECAGRPYAY